MTKHYPATFVLLSSLLLVACSDNNDENNDSSTGDSTTGDSDTGSTGSAEFEISVINLTNNQPLSPVAVILHSSEYSPWRIGSAASSGLELMAEGGDNSDMIGADLNGIDSNAASGTGIVVPGGSESISVAADSAGQTSLSVATMLVNTNDAFTGLAGVDLSAMASGDSLTLVAPVYDAGTESNSEASGTIPGPADGGEGYNSARDDSDRVFRHAGVVTADDGLDTSVLNESHRFDNPAMRVTITRL